MTHRHIPVLHSARAAACVLAASVFCAAAASAARAENRPAAAENCTFQIVYEDRAEGEGSTDDPVAGAEFTFYRVAGTGDIRMPGKALIAGVKADESTDPAAIVKTVQEAYGRTPGPEGGAVYTVSTGADGRAVCGQMQPGIYLCVETKPAAGHFASVPFLTALPYTSDDGTELLYSRTAEPKSIPTGRLRITKRVEGSAGEKNREFHFRVEFGAGGESSDSSGGTAGGENDKSAAGSITALLPESLHFTKSDGTEGQISNGGSVSLKDGQSVVFDMVPAGMTYTVSEEEAGKDGYAAKAQGETGVIRRTVQAESVFTNTREKAADKGEASRTMGQSVQTGDTFLLLAAGALAVFTLYMAGKKRGR